jgi:hypothetical protein
MRHTSKPWAVNAIKGNRIVGDASATEYDKLQINGANCTVATVYRAADARLIVRAPQMWEWLQRLSAANRTSTQALRYAWEDMSTDVRTMLGEEN